MEVVEEGVEARHQGLGTPLLAKVKKFALQHGYCKVRIGTLVEPHARVWGLMSWN